MKALCFASMPESSLLEQTNFQGDRRSGLKPKIARSQVQQCSFSMRYFPYFLHLGHFIEQEATTAAASSTVSQVAASIGAVESTRSIFVVVKRYFAHSRIAVAKMRRSRPTLMGRPPYFLA